VPADVLLVLEMNGPAYQRELSRACRPRAGIRDRDAARSCASEKKETSRLFIVDAGLDRNALRRKYPQANVYAIVRGEIEAATIATVSSTAESRVVGYVRGPVIEEIQVPRSMRDALGDSNALERNRAERPERPFTATIAFGRRLEPWIVRLLPAQPAATGR
jgi:hypothetical protein